MLMEDARERAIEIFRILDRTYPNASSTVDYSTPFELLIVSIIGARATDESVNRISPRLFAKHPTPEAFAGADYDTLVQELHDVGLAEPKAKYVIETSRIISRAFHGEVPCSMHELLELPGVGRKIANMVLGHVCGEPAMIVDTHVARVSYRLGLTDSTNPTTAEREMKAILPPQYWTHWNHLMIAHGRSICTARDPKHGICPVLQLCPCGLRVMARQREHTRLAA
jgi:endonuclease III